ncbi:MAG TPA: alkaline phosphatase family protein [Phycisphaerae bacterium]|nr:alkaline phosphatase family protein [Phycisphaerae bacterium]
MALPLLETNCVAEELRKKVLVIGVDGTRLDALKVARTPNLDALKAGGCFSDRAITHPVTHSAACWSSFFTGVWGDKHLVNDPGNSFAGNQFGRYPNFLRRLEIANSNLNTVAYTRWADLRNVLGGVDAVTNFSSDAAIATATCSLLAQGDPDVFYTILLDVDSAGHSYGWGASVSNYVRAIETADGRLGQIVSALTNRVTFAQEDWLMVVLSDHGMHDGSMENSRMTFHLVWGRSAARGTIWPSPSIVDASATVLTHMGVAIDPAWNLDARVEGLPLPPPRYGTNLIFNGDAEFSSGTDNYGASTNNAGLLKVTPNRGIAWWFDPGAVTLARYGAHPEFPDVSSPGPGSRGTNFFLGGLGTTNVVSQTIDLSALAADIDDPGVEYVLSGWLGGRGGQAAAAAFAARFLDADGEPLGTNGLGPVSAGDRGSVTGLQERSCTGSLPVGTRLVEFVLTAQAPTTTNDASADNLSFVLIPRAHPPFSILALARTNGTWQVEFETQTSRLYSLQRSLTFDGWENVGTAILGDGSRQTLVDVNPPAGQAFYRICTGRFSHRKAH